MKLAIMQPYLFPYLGYFQLIHSVDRFVVLDDVNYINKGYVNRNSILLNGNRYAFVLPLKKASQNALIREITLSGDPKMKGKFLKTIEMAYKKAPYFSEIFPILEEIINCNKDNLSEFVGFSIERICERLGIHTELIPSSVVYDKKGLFGSDRILDIALQNGATIYVNPIGGTELYDFEEFKSKEIELRFIEMRKTEYKQFNNDFEGNLSIIDVMMFNSPAEISELLNDFKFVINNK